MDTNKLLFLMSIQQQIDKLEYKFGHDHPEVAKARHKFSQLSQSEMHGDSLSTLIHNDTKTIKVDVQDLKVDLKEIRGILEIRGERSVDYSFIPDIDKKVRNQLVKDNIRMENVRLDNTIKDEMDRFHSFCTNAFYQIEEIINYYFSKKYIFNEFVELLKKKNKGYIHKDGKKYLEIEIGSKIYLFEDLFYFNKRDSSGKIIYYDSVIQLIRNVRNEDSHRCSIIEVDTDKILENYESLQNKIKTKTLNYTTYYEMSKQEKDLEKQAKHLVFIKEKNYNKVRNAIEDLISKIRIDLSSQPSNA